MDLGVLGTLLSDKPWYNDGVRLENLHGFDIELVSIIFVSHLCMISENKSAIWGWLTSQP